MQVTILGESGDERGSQLERLTARLLQRLGYSRVHTNSISSGGHEIDVRASLAVPSLSVAQETPLICECKAHAHPIDTPEWLKFLGKIYTEQAATSRETRGMMIALSGVNGNVSGAYEALRTAGRPVELLTGVDLARVLIKEYDLCSLDDVTTYVRSRTEEVPVDIRLTFFESPRWLVQFADGSFILVSGVRPSSDSHPQAIALVLAALGATRHRDLDEERLAKDRALFARKVLLAVCIAEPDGATLGALAALTVRAANREPLDAHDYTNAADALQNAGMIAGSADTAWRVSELDSLERIIAVLLLLTEGSGIAIPIGTPRYQAMFDERLAAYILEKQGGITLSKELVREALTLLRWSPSALAWALRPDMMLTRTASDGITNPTFEESSVRYFRLQLLQRASADFHASALYEAYFERLGLTELETRRVVRFKSMRETVLELDLSERFGIKRCAPEMGAQFAGIWLVADAPEPWNWPTSSRNDETTETDEGG